MEQFPAMSSFRARVRGGLGVAGPSCSACARRAGDIERHADASLLKPQRAARSQQHRTLSSPTQNSTWTPKEHTTRSGMPNCDGGILTHALCPSVTEDISKGSLLALFISLIHMLGGPAMLVADRRPTPGKSRGGQTARWRKPRHADLPTLIVRRTAGVGTHTSDTQHSLSQGLSFPDLIPFSNGVSAIVIVAITAAIRGQVPDAHGEWLPVPAAGALHGSHGAPWFQFHFRGPARHHF